MPLPSSISDVSYPTDATIPYNVKVGRYTRGEKPPGAVALTSKEVETIMFREIQAWKPRSEMWPFTKGLGIVGSASALSGIIFNNHYRTKFKLLNYARKASYLPSTVLPTITAMTLHGALVSGPLISQKLDCPTCAEIRAICCQMISGVLQPWGLAVLSSLIIARTRHTIPLPKIVDYKGMFLMLQKMTRPIYLNIGLMVSINVLAAAVLTQEETRAVIKLWKKVFIPVTPDTEDIQDME